MRKFKFPTGRAGAKQGYLFGVKTTPARHCAGYFVKTVTPPLPFPSAKRAVGAVGVVGSGQLAVGSWQWAAGSWQSRPAASGFSFSLARY